MVANPYTPKITNLEVNTLSGVANGKVTLTATIVTTSPIDDIEVEFHGDKEYDVDIYGYYYNQDFSIPRGSKAYDASQEIQIPTTVEPGDYHFVIRLTDQAGYQQIRAMAIKIK